MTRTGLSGSLLKVQENMVVTRARSIERYKIKPGQTTAVPDAVVDHDELVGVTPEMIDWWWVNMRRVILVEPNDHKSFV
jgi:hypothetical protein